MYVAVGFIKSTMPLQREPYAPFAVVLKPSTCFPISGAQTCFMIPNLFLNGIKMGKWVRLTNIKYLIAFWNDLQPYVFCICVFARCVYFCIWETSMDIRVHQNIKKFSEFHSHLIYVVSMKEDQKCKKKVFGGVFLSWLREAII